MGTCGDWLVTYFRRVLGLNYSEARSLYEYVDKWDGDYNGIVGKFIPYSPRISLPAIMYALVVAGSTGPLEMGRAVHRLTGSYEVFKVSPTVLGLLSDKKIDQSFLNCLGKELSTFPLMLFGGKHKASHRHQRSKVCKLLYLRMCALAALHDMILASNRLDTEYRALHDDIVDIIETRVYYKPWRGTCDGVTGLYGDEIQNIVSAIMHRRRSYYWSKG